MFGNSLVYSAHSARVPDFIAEKDATFRSFRSDNNNLFPQRGAVSKFHGSTRAVPFTSPNYHACPTKCWGKNINVNYFVVCLTIPASGSEGASVDVTLDIKKEHAKQNYLVK